MKDHLCFHSRIIDNIDKRFLVQDLVCPGSRRRDCSFTQPLQDGIRERLVKGQFLMAALIMLGQNLPESPDLYIALHRVPPQLYIQERHRQTRSSS